MIDPLTCLAIAIYFEARGEPLEGKVAVGQVVMNRVKDRRWPMDVCSVVKDRCQFSFYCDGKPERLSKKGLASTAYKESVEAAYVTLKGHAVDNTIGSVYYHADYVAPYWSQVFVKTVKIGRHIFYRDKL
jgi:spore germination cell wall hydrolase CwlJ-like protein